MLISVPVEKSSKQIGHTDCPPEGNGYTAEGKALISVSERPSVGINGAGAGTPSSTSAACSAAPCICPPIHFVSKKTSNTSDMKPPPDKAQTNIHLYGDDQSCSLWRSSKCFARWCASSNPLAGSKSLWKKNRMSLSSTRVLSFCYFLLSLSIFYYNAHKLRQNFVLFDTLFLPEIPLSVWSRLNNLIK
jgi:hypothetical protein